MKESEIEKLKGCIQLLNEISEGIHNELSPCLFEEYSMRIEAIKDVLKKYTNQNITTQNINWLCTEDFVMQNRDKETAFLKGHIYNEVENYDKAIGLINEQGYLHTISGSSFRHFEIINEKTKGENQSDK